MNHPQHTDDPWWLSEFPDEPSGPVPERQEFDYTKKATAKNPVEFEEVDLTEWLEFADTPQYDNGGALAAELGTAEVILLAPDRRADGERLGVETSVTIRHGSNEEQATMLNISPGGMVIRAHVAGRPGSKLSITAETMDGPVSLTGEVRWVRLLEEGEHHAFELGMRLPAPPARWQTLYESLRWGARGRRAG
ncbi:MAG: hypothetical protein ACI9OJ_005441 [Myxococcota bacterium]|jgi:hypothetical protein